MDQLDTVRTINLEPHWAGLKRWAEAGLATARKPSEKRAFQTVLDECAKAKAAGRPNS